MTDTSVIIGDLPGPQPEVDLPQIAEPEPVYEQAAGEPVRITVEPGSVEGQPAEVEFDRDPDTDWFYLNFGGSRNKAHSLPTNFDAEASGINPDFMPVDDDAYYQGPPPQDEVDANGEPVVRPPVTDETLLEDNTWMFAADQAHQMMNNVPHPDFDAAMSGDRAARERLSEYGKTWAAGFDWSMWDMGVSTYALTQSEGLQPQAALYLLEKYREKGTTKEDVYRAFGEVFTDPIAAATLLTTFGLGNIIARGTAYTFKQGVKAYAKRAVPHAAVGAALGAPFAGLHNAADQHVRIQADVQEGIDPTELGRAAGAGAVAGGVITGVVGPAVEAGVNKLISTATSKMRQGQWNSALEDLELAQRMRDAATPADLDVALPSPAPTGPRQLPLVPDEPRQTAADLPGEPVAEMPPKPPVADDLDALGFYSAASRAAQELPQEKGPPAQMRQMLLKGAGVREEELAWTGLDELFDRKVREGKKARVTKQEIIETLQNNRVRITEMEGVKIERGGREEYEADPETVPTAWTSEVIDDPDYITSRADDMRSELDFYWDQVADKVSPRSVRGHVLAELGITPGSDQALYLSLDHPEALDVPFYLSEMDFLRVVADLKDLGVISDEVADDVAWDGVLQRIADVGDADDALYDLAKAEYDDDPYYRYFDESGHGYVITGSNNIGWELETPGTGGNRVFERLDDAQEGAIDHAYEHGYIEYLSEGGEFTPEYKGWTMGGGTNYRELLIQFEGAESYRAGHFSDDFAEGFVADRDREMQAFGDVIDLDEDQLVSPENVLAHVRLKDRTINGEKVLSIEEIQSDWHKMQRKQGGGYELPAYRRDVAKEEAKLKEAEERIEKMFHSASELSDEQRVEASAVFRALTADLNLSPDSEFMVGREEYSFERAFFEELNAYHLLLKDLVNRERIAYPTLARYSEASTAGPVRRLGLKPETQALLDEYRSAVDARDNLRREINEISRSRRPDAPWKTMDERGWPQLVMRRLMRYAVENDYDRIAWSPGDVQADRYNAPRELYDKTIPKVVNKIIKKFDPSMKIDDGVADGYNLPNIKITSKMRDSIKRLGQAIFTLTGGVGLAEMMQAEEHPQPQ